MTPEQFKQLDLSRERKRIDRLTALKKELLDMLGSDTPNMAQEGILKNIDIDIDRKKAFLAEFNSPTSE